MTGRKSLTFGIAFIIDFLHQRLKVPKIMSKQMSSNPIPCFFFSFIEEACRPRS
jgi:hypothetical protein